LTVAVVASAAQLGGVLSQRAAATPEPPTPSDSASPFRALTPEVQRWSSEIQSWADAYHLPAPLIATVMQIESCGNAQAQSGVGAQGLFQVMPFHFASGESPIDPETNAQRGLGYLGRALELSGGRVDRALAGYNGGHSRITQPPELWPDETRRYVAWGTAIYADVTSGQAASPALAEWLQAGGTRLCQSASKADA